MIDVLEAMGEKQPDILVFDRMVVSKVRASQKITLNKIEIWNHTDEGQSKRKAESSPWLKNCLNTKLTISLKACSKMVKMTSNYIMARKLKLLNH